MVQLLFEYFLLQNQFLCFVFYLFLSVSQVNFKFLLIFSQLMLILLEIKNFLFSFEYHLFP